MLDTNWRQCAVSTCTRVTVEVTNVCERCTRRLPKAVRAELKGIVLEHKRGELDESEVRDLAIHHLESAGLQVATTPPERLHLVWYHPDTAGFPSGVNGLGWPRDDF